MPLSKKLFYLLLFLLPLNLGKHFILDISFVKGILVDYLIPTVYVQDLLVVTILSFYIYENINNSRNINSNNILNILKNLKETLFNLFFHKKFTILYFFLFSVLLSSLISSLPFISIVSFVRLFIYVLLFIYISKNIKIVKEIDLILNILILSLSLVSILGIFQFVFKGSVFDNYLFFGEQPYSFSTPGIPKENVFGFSVIPSYGLFRHPNIFAGVLSVVLLLNMFQVRKYGFKRYYFIVTVFLIFIAFVLTFSMSAYFSLFLVFTSYLILLTLKKFYFKYRLNLFPSLFSLFFLCLISLSIFSFSFVFSFSTNFNIDSFTESLTRRFYLTDASLNLIQDNFLYGVGISAFTQNIENYVIYINDVRFLQPVHNVFLLILSETGFISFTFFIILLAISLHRLLKILYELSLADSLDFKYNDYISIALLLFIALLLVLLLFLFDHYFWTIHQTMLLFWIVLGLCWTNDLDY